MSTLPADDEVAAAILALIATRAAAATTPAAQPPSLWRDHTALLGATARPGRDAWRAAGRPS